MKKYIGLALSSLFSIAVSFFVTGCVKDLTGTVYSGPDLVEFANPITKSVTTTVTPKRDSILVQLIGRQRSTAISVIYEINNSSTAVTATDYSIITPSPITIDPNTSSAWIKFTLNKVNATKTLLVDLTGGDNVQPSANYKTFTYTLK